MIKTVIVLLSYAFIALASFAQDVSPQVLEGDHQEPHQEHDTPRQKDKSGVALLAGIISYDSYIGAALEADSGSERVFKFGADYTFSQGVILGLDATGLQALESDRAFGTAYVFTGYEFDGGIRFKTGLGCIIIDDQAAAEINAEVGYTLGLGYVFDSGIIIEAAYTQIGFKGHQYGNTAFAVGYKF
ncbi:MAG: hypothetical protein ACI86X_002007 [Moritella sp.]|jgi:hypothetical protein